MTLGSFDSFLGDLLLLWVYGGWSLSSLLLVNHLEGFVDSNGKVVEALEVLLDLLNWETDQHTGDLGGLKAATDHLDEVIDHVTNLLLDIWVSLINGSNDLNSSILILLLRGHDGTIDWLILSWSLWLTLISWLRRLRRLLLVVLVSLIVLVVLSVLVIISLTTIVVVVLVVSSSSVVLTTSVVTLSTLIVVVLSILLVIHLLLLLLVNRECLHETLNQVG